MTKFLTQVNNLVWGMPLILLLLGTGIYFTTHLKFIQFVRLKKAFSLIFKKNENQEGDVSSFQALCTALSSPIGTGDIVRFLQVVLAHYSGCGFLLSLEWLLNMLKVFSLSSIVQRMKTDK